MRKNKNSFIKLDLLMILNVLHNWSKQRSTISKKKDLHKHFQCLKIHEMQESLSWRLLQIAFYGLNFVKKMIILEFFVVLMVQRIL